jgi:hypothetical protein
MKHELIKLKELDLQKERERQRRMDVSVRNSNYFDISRVRESER